MKKAADDLPLFARQAPRFSPSASSTKSSGVPSSKSWTGYGSLVRSLIFVSHLPSLLLHAQDDKSQILAVMFRRRGVALSFTPENGMEVLCFGKVSLYPVRGDVQLYVENMEPRGQGALCLAFEQLKRKLSAEGLFAEERKRGVAVLACLDRHCDLGKGAALRDMLRIIGDRYPDRRIVVWPVKVQGEGGRRNCRGDHRARSIG